eukprot:Lithocolla_globosa_v1_NODE_192_length_5318_cov_28.700741.p3 type:complete len:359 gc:universal NODE_192_length_5318_cov_28.700741:1595-519(-)
MFENVEVWDFPAHNAKSLKTIVPVLDKVRALFSNKSTWMFILDSINEKEHRVRFVEFGDKKKHVKTFPPMDLHSIVITQDDHLLMISKTPTTSNMSNLPKTGLCWFQSDGWCSVPLRILDHTGEEVKWDLFALITASRTHLVIQDQTPHETTIILCKLEHGQMYSMVRQIHHLEIRDNANQKNIKFSLDGSVLFHAFNYPTIGLAIYCVKTGICLFRQSTEVACGYISSLDILNDQRTVVLSAKPDDYMKHVAVFVLEMSCSHHQIVQKPKDSVTMLIKVWFANIGVVTTGIKLKRAIDCPSLLTGQKQEVASNLMAQIEESEEYESETDQDQTDEEDIYGAELSADAEAFSSFLSSG